MRRPDQGHQSSWRSGGWKKVVHKVFVDIPYEPPRACLVVSMGLIGRYYQNLRIMVPRPEKPIRRRLFLVFRYRRSCRDRRIRPCKDRLTIVSSTKGETSLEPVHGRSCWYGFLEYCEGSGRSDRCFGRRC